MAWSSLHVHRRTRHTLRGAEILQQGDTILAAKIDEFNMFHTIIKENTCKDNAEFRVKFNLMKLRNY